MALLCTKLVSQILGTTIPRRLSFQTAGGHELQVKKKSNLENKVAVVTGGASGIGASITKALLKDGLSAVAIIDQDKEKLDEFAKKLTKDYGEDRVLPIEANVTNIEQMDAAFRNTVLYYHVLDFIINNAGIMDDTKWETQLKTNMNGCVIGTMLGMQYMAKTSQGSGGIIVNIGSIMSVIPSCGFPVYTMTQFGIAGKIAIGYITTTRLLFIKVFNLLYTAHRVKLKANHFSIPRI